ncbi:2OG-Fe(II) oxygenase family oxidoreductase [Medicago truncatula]|uniref:2OG-Fe(II) oxygenase family oxidoreductase n=1 Tax=Medicago truncatula TaxID=3880 RepID=A0A072U7E0_MEDTR|nr:2OG-Fe(II) oxygenase family oxidoreductase [Medicago truncatula]
MDGKLVSSWYNLHSSVPQSYVQPPERQPCNAVHVLSTNQKVPVIDLGGHDRDDIIRNIIKASEEYGFFQVVNHGVAKELMDDTYKIFKEFHAMLANEKVRESSKDPNGSCKLYTSCGGNINDVAKYWKDSLEHRCPPSGEFTWYWPEKPDGYREIVGRYTQELRALALRILDLISEGLELNPNYFTGELSDSPVVISHHYPPCPEPSLTLGAPQHKDPNILTILFQQPEITALQILKDGAWIPIEPIPNAFVIISNGRLKGAEHRVITNSSTSRYTIAYFIYPRKEAIIGPAKPLLSSTSPPIYSSMEFGEMLENLYNKGPNFENELHL